MSTDGAGMPSTDSTLEDKIHENPSSDGSLRSSVRKAADFLWTSQRIYSGIDSPFKSRRYVHLQLKEMFASLVELYSEVFASNWPHFKRFNEAANIGNSAEEAQQIMAQIYISHWMLDLYNSVRTSVEKLSPVALAEYFEDRAEDSSNEYDAFLSHLIAVIRPTHIVGCYEDTIFIPRFSDKLEMLNNNPFDIDKFSLDYRKFRAIITAIKDKRAGWKTALTNNETVGRPVWLFDWIATDYACAWFPKAGNYTSEDVMYAYLIGVACTPKLAHQDMDDWNDFPTAMDKMNADLSKLKLQTPRIYFGAYEKDTYSVREEKFTIPPPEDAEPDTPPRSKKRSRPSREESDSSRPAIGQTSTDGDSSFGETKDVTVVQRATHIYYARVILKSNLNTRVGTLLGLLLDPTTHAIH